MIDEENERLSNNQYHDTERAYFEAVDKIKRDFFTLHHGKLAEKIFNSAKIRVEAEGVEG